MLRELTFVHRHTILRKCQISGLMRCRGVEEKTMIKRTKTAISPVRTAEYKEHTL